MKTFVVVCVVALAAAALLDVAEADTKYVEFDSDLKYSVFSDTACDKAECPGRKIFKIQTFSGTSAPDTTCAAWACTGDLSSPTCTRSCTPKTGDKYNETYKPAADAKWNCQGFDCSAQTSCKRQCEKATEEAKIECDKQAADNSLGCATGKTVTDTVVGGKVTRAALPGVTVKIGRCEVTSDANGEFLICAQPGAATKEFSKTSYVPATVRSTLSKGQTTSVGDVVLMKSCDTKATLTGRVRNAINKNPVAGMVITVLPGVGSTTGSGGVTATTDVNGVYTINDLAAGTYTLTGRKTGFIDSSVTAGAVCSATVNAPDIITSPELKNGELMRTVLAWGKKPLDLDLHLVIHDIGGIGKNENHPRVNWMEVGTSGAPYYASLDVDEMDGNGPETITIYKALAKEYRFYVHNYSMGPRLDLSQASITAYKADVAGVWKKLTIPSKICADDVGHENCDEINGCPCEYWDLFSWNGKTNQSTIYNKIQKAEPIPNPNGF